MLLQLPNQAEPLTLKGPQLFVDWRNVDQGMLEWMADGKKVSQWGGEEDPLPHAATAYGIALEGAHPELVGPMLPMDKPWEQGYLMFVNNILREDGKYRLWYTVVPDDFRYREDRGYDFDCGWVLCYAESRDGFHWVKPELGIMQFEGQETNWVYGREINANYFSSGCVFRDDNPRCPDSERYKLIYRSIETPGDMDAWRARQMERFDGDCDPRCLARNYNTPSNAPMAEGLTLQYSGKRMRGETCSPLSGAVSPDGIHWTPIEEPLMMYCSEQMNACFWDPATEKYIGCFRMNRAGRRTVGRSETADFRKWPTPTPCLEAPLTWHPSHDIMHCPILKYPGTEDLYVMLATVFRRNSDCRDLQLAVSADSYYWNWLPGDTTADRRQGTVWPFDDIEFGDNFVELPDGRIGVPVAAFAYPYKYPRHLISGERTPPLGEAGYAVFKPGRLCSVSAPDRGEFSTRCFRMTGSRVTLNFETYGHGGYILAELRRKSGEPIPGYTFGEFRPLSGDELDRPLAWSGSDDLSPLRGENIRICFRLHMSRIYAFELKD